MRIALAVAWGTSMPRETTVPRALRVVCFFFPFAIGVPRSMCRKETLLLRGQRPPRSLVRRKKAGNRRGVVDPS